MSLPSKILSQEELMEEVIPLVDETDKVIGSSTKRAG